MFIESRNRKFVKGNFLLHLWWIVFLQVYKLAHWQNTVRLRIYFISFHPFVATVVNRLMEVVLLGKFSLPGLLTPAVQLNLDQFPRVCFMRWCSWAGNTAQKKNIEATQSILRLFFSRALPSPDTNDIFCMLSLFSVVFFSLLYFPRPSPLWAIIWLNHKSRWDEESR